MSDPAQVHYPHTLNLYNFKMEENGFIILEISEIMTIDTKNFLIKHQLFGKWNETVILPTAL